MGESTLKNGVLQREITVEKDVIDENGHTNNVTFVQWMQDAAVEHSEMSGGTEAMKKAGGSWFIRYHRIEYLKPAFEGDRILVSTWVANMMRIKSLRKYRFVRVTDGELLARGETDWVFVDTETGRPTRIPSSVSECFPLREF